MPKAKRGFKSLSRIMKKIDLLSIFFMAGHESHAGNPVVLDFILVGQKLGELGFSYHKNRVMVLHPGKQYY